MRGFLGVTRLKALHPSYKAGIAGGTLFLVLFALRWVLFYEPPPQRDWMGMVIWNFFPESMLDWATFVLPGILAGIAVALAVRSNEECRVLDPRVCIAVPGTVASVVGILVLGTPIAAFIVGFGSGLSDSISWGFTTGIAWLLIALLLVAIFGTLVLATIVALVAFTALPSYLVTMFLVRRIVGSKIA